MSLKYLYNNLWW